MGRYYSDEDVRRWEEVNANSMEIHRAKLASKLSQKGIDFHLGMLGLTYHSLAMTLVAKGNYPEAINSFRSSVETKCRMYERYEEGLGRELEAGEFQSLLVSLVTRDEALTGKLAGLFRVDVGTPDSLYLGRALKSILLSDLDGARKALSEKKPHFETQFRGYPDCLDAILNKDRARFVTAIAEAAKLWARWASRVVKGLPDSVCFIQGVGLALLAQKVIDEPIAITNEHLPPQLLS